jgi:galactose-1-phosphate uridylyltransferase
VYESRAERPVWACAIKNLGSVLRGEVAPSSLPIIMEDPEHWKEVCELAAKEQDHQKLMKLTQEILRLLDEKEARLQAIRPPTAQSPRSGNS